MTKALILNVDDYDPARYARSLLLRQAGFDVKEAVDGDEALRVAVNEGPEVVLLDVNLPDMSGFEVCRRLKADPVTACVSVLHVSATQVAPRDAAFGLEGGADAYLVEPVDPAVLVATVHALLRLRRAEGSVQELLAREQAARAEAERANRAKDEFLAMLAHELRNPLAPIINALDVVQSSAADNPKVQAAVRTAERQARHLARLLDDLLDLRRSVLGMEVRRQPVDVAKVIGNIVENQRTTIRANRLDLSVSLPDEPLIVDADPTRLEQIIGNLVNNATKYTPPGGAIWISGSREGEHAVIRVRDNGLGISSNLLPRVFDLFTQGDPSLTRSRGGLGIGLALVRRLVELHGGSVKVQSEGPGRGSEFMVRLPLVAVSSPAQERLGDQATVAKPRRVLIIEDNADAREMLRTALELDGHQVAAVENGPQGVSHAVDLNPEIVIADLGLPDLDGYEVARQIRQKLGPAVRLVALTGYGGPEHRRRAEEAGFDAHLVKPVDIETLRRILGP